MYGFFIEKFLFNRVFIVWVNRLSNRGVNTTDLNPLMKLAFKKYLVDDNEVEVNYYLKAVVLVEKLESLYVYKHI